MIETRRGDMQPQLLTSKSEHWCTPPEIIERIEDHLGVVGLDPCSNTYSVVKAQARLDGTAGKDGLVHSWQSSGLVYVNPPYGRKLPHWAKKMAAEAALGTEIVSLLPARTDTRWFHDHILPYATSMVFIRGRLKFIDGVSGNAKNPATFPSMLVYFGDNKTAFCNAFKDKGFVLELR